MKRVHDETWEVDKCCADCTNVSLTEGGFAVASMGATIDDPEWQVARARLAAQAPAMARLLLTIHTAMVNDGGGEPTPIEIVLRAAGVIE